MKIKKLTVLLIAIVVALSGCVIGDNVSDTQVGIHTNAGKVVSEVSPGLVRLWGYYDDLEKVDVGVKTFIFEEESLATSDKQLVSAKLGVSVRRKRENAVDMFVNYRQAALDDATLQSLVFNKLSRVAKESFSQRTIDELLGITEAGGRTASANDILNALQAEVDEFYVQVVDVGINDIDPGPTYVQILDDKAKAQGRAEVAAAQAKEKAEQLKAEQAETAIQLEIARRDKEVLLEQGRAYEQSPELLELERAKIYAEAIKSGNLVVLPAESNIFTQGLMSGNAVVPFAAGSK